MSAAPSLALTHCSLRYREVSNLEGVGSPGAISVKDEEEKQKQHN